MVKSQERIEFANLLRGLAALMVVCSHYFGVFWYRPEVVSYFTGIPTPNTQSNFLYTISEYIVKASPFDLGPLGVGIFFLISGFVIPFSIINTSNKGFFFNRIVRIYPTYIAGFSIAIASIYFANKFFNSEFPHSIKNILLHSLPGLREIFDSPNIDGVVWTLEIELKFYLLWLFIGHKKVNIKSLYITVTTLIFTEIISLLISNFLNTDKISATRCLYIIQYNIPYLIFFFIGTLFYFHYKRIISTSHLIISSTIFILLTTFSWRLGPQANIFPVVLNYIAAFFVFLICYLYPVIIIRFRRILTPLSKMSYSLYASHSILGYCIQSLLLNLGWKSYSLIPAFIGAICTAFLINKYVEMPSQKLGKYFSQKVFPLKK